MNLIIVFFFGAVLGSFFYTLSARFIDGSFANNKYNALFGFSKCPKCGSTINPVYLIPIIGYVILKGKCRQCGGNISKVYPLMEIFFGAVSCLVYLQSGFNLSSLIIFLIFGISISISVIDIKTLTIPNSLIGFFLALSIYPVILNSNIKDNIFGFLLMGVFFAAVLLVFPGSFGGGDVKFAAAIGILLGFELSIVALETALVTGSLIGLVYVVKSRRGFKIKMPFAPFLSAGVFVSLMYGRDILLIYYSAFS